MPYRPPLVAREVFVADPPELPEGADPRPRWPWWYALAGLGAGLWENEGEIASMWQLEKRFEPAMSRDAADARRQIVEVAAVLGHPERGEAKAPDSDPDRRLFAAFRKAIVALRESR